MELFLTLPYLSRQVDSTDGEKLAKLNDCAWIETSAKNGTNISAFPFILFGTLNFGRWDYYGPLVFP